MALNANEKKISVGQLGGRGLLVILLVVSLVLLVAYVREGDEGALHSLQDSTSALTVPLSSAGSSTGSLAASATSALGDLTASDQTMSELQQSNATLSQMVIELEEYRQEATRLESLIGLHDAYGFTSVASRVVAYSSDSYNRIVTIDTGSTSGVSAGLPVMGSTGVVGQVISVDSYSSQVRLLNDAQSGVAVLLQSSRAEGILSGSVDGALYLEGIDENVEVAEGEAVITSGLGGGYFRGLVIGTVSKVEKRQGDATRTIVVTPNASFDDLSEVLVVLGMSDDAAAADDASTANAVIEAVGPDALLNTDSSQDSTDESSADSSDEASEETSQRSSQSSSASDNEEDE